MATYVLCLVLMIPQTVSACGELVQIPGQVTSNFDATNCGYIDFPVGVFPNNTDISYLIFTNNDFVAFSLPENITIPAMYFVYLNDNQLEGFPDFKSVGRLLRHLHLNNNKITGIDSGLLIQMVALESLYLEHNLLTSMPDVEIPSANFRTLVLANNDFTTFPMLRKLGKNITVLEVDTNHIGDFDIEDNGVYPMITRLFIQSNEFTRCPNISYLGNSLVNLVIDSNNIGPIPIDILESLIVLENLSIRKTELKGEFPDLSPIGDTLLDLAIGVNELTDLPRHLLEPLVKLETLNLDYNKFTRLPDISVLLDTLKNLIISFMNFEDAQVVVDYVFDVMAGHGMTVDLRQLSVPSIPPTLCDLGKDYTYLRLQYMPLVCDCRLRWLKVATMSGQQTDLENFAACQGGPQRLTSTLWKDITLPDLVCDEPSSVSYAISAINFSCLDMPADEEDYGNTSHLDCAHACKKHESCFMLRYSSGKCSLIVQGTGRISDVSHLYKIV